MLDQPVYFSSPPDVKEETLGRHHQTRSQECVTSSCVVISIIYSGADLELSKGKLFSIVIG